MPLRPFLLVFCHLLFMECENFLWRKFYCIHWLQDSSGIEIDTDVLQSDYEKIRREKFEAILKIQQENSGLIEPRKNEVLMPGMYLPQPVSLPPIEPDVVSSEPQNKDGAGRLNTNPGSSFNRPGPKKHNNSNMRRHRTQNSSKQGRHWIRKDNDSQRWIHDFCPYF